MAPSTDGTRHTRAAQGEEVYARTMALGAGVLAAFAILSITGSASLMALNSHQLKHADNWIVIITNALSFVGSAMLIEKYLRLNLSEKANFYLLMVTEVHLLLQSGVTLAVTIASRAGADLTQGAFCEATAFVMQFVWFTVVMWGGVLSIHMLLTYIYPLDCVRMRRVMLKYYYISVYGGSLLTASCITFGGPLQPYVEHTYCWTTGSFALYFYDGPVCALGILNLGTCIFLVYRIITNPKDRMNEVRLGMIAWVLKITAPFLFSDVWYFGIDFRAPGAPQWTGVLGDFFAGIQGLVLSLLFLPNINRVIQARLLSQLEQAAPLPPKSRTSTTVTIDMTAPDYFTTTSPMIDVVAIKYDLDS